METSKRAYAKGSLPGMLLPVSPSMLWAPADPCLHRRPSKITGVLGSISCHCSFPLGLGAPILFGPPRLESLFLPVLWKSYNQIPLVFKVRVSGDPQFLCLISRLRSSEPSQHWENFVIIVLQFVGHLPSRYGISFYHDCAIPTILLWFHICLWRWSIFLVGFSVLLSMVVQQLVANSQEEMSTCPSTPPSWTGRSSCPVFIIICF